MMAAVAEKPDPMPVGLVGEAVLIVAAVALTVIDGVRAVRARARRWPMPGTLGVLTNDDIDRLPEPERS